MQKGSKYYFEVLYRRGFATASSTSLVLYQWLLTAVLKAAACPSMASAHAELEHVHGVYTGGGDGGSRFIGFAIHASHGNSTSERTRGLVRTINMQKPRRAGDGLAGNMTVRSGWDLKAKVTASPTSHRQRISSLVFCTEPDMSFVS